jgi:hypothetical protein
MPTDISKATFDAIFEKSGLPLSEAQKAELFGVYPLFSAILARATLDMPRESEPAVMFQPEVK